MSKKTKFPIASFGTELMSALLRGAREKYTIRFDNIEDLDKSGWRKAKRFQARIHTLRARMREENHPDFPLAARSVVSVLTGTMAVEAGGPREWAGDEIGHRGALVMLRPKDSEFKGELERAGVEIHSPHEDPPSEPGRPVVADKKDRFLDMFNVMNDTESE